MSETFLPLTFCPLIIKNEDFSSWITDLTQKFRKIQAAQQGILESFSETLKTDLPLRVQRVDVLGFTPLWNDGDECLHSNYLSFDGVDHSGFFASWVNDPEDEFQGLWLEDLQSLAKKKLSPLIASFENLFGTNWQLTWIREGEDFVLTWAPFNPPH